MALPLKWQNPIIHKHTSICEDTSQAKYWVCDADLQGTYSTYASSCSLPHRGEGGSSLTEPKENASITHKLCLWQQNKDHNKAISQRWRQIQKHTSLSLSSDQGFCAAHPLFWLSISSSGAGPTENLGDKDEEVVNTGGKDEEVVIRCRRCSLAGTKTHWQLNKRWEASHSQCDLLNPILVYNV